jgi:hypothetical protein
MSDAGFICALRRAFAQLSGIPIAGVRVVSARGDGDYVHAALSQGNDSCGAARRLSEHLVRRAQSLSSISLVIEVLAPSSSNEKVRSAVQVAFRLNSTLIDSVFSAVTLAACFAQGIAAQLCPNPPSFVLSLVVVPSEGTASPSNHDPSSILVPGVIGGLVVVLVVVAAVLVWRKLSRDRHPSKIRPRVTIRQPQQSRVRTITPL